MNLNSILIGTDDAPRMVEYYTRLLGEPAMVEGDYCTWVLGSGGMTVAPHSEVHGKNEQPGRVIWNVESDDVPADFARMRDAGAIVVREPYSFEEIPNTWVATLSDPDGNYFQLISPFDPSTLNV
jgi:predicted enzyme related to lactoylglutathione lyase